MAIDLRESRQLIDLMQAPELGESQRQVREYDYSAMCAIAVSLIFYIQRDILERNSITSRSDFQVLANDPEFCFILKRIFEDSLEERLMSIPAFLDLVRSNLLKLQRIVGQLDKVEAQYRELLASIAPAVSLAVVFSQQLPEASQKVPLAAQG